MTIAGTATGVAQDILDAALADLAAHDVRVDTALAQAILSDFHAEVQKASRRVVQRLAAAARACEAVDSHRGRWKPCGRPGETLRDGRRACSRHARAQTARWALTR